MLTPDPGRLVGLLDREGGILWTYGLCNVCKRQEVSLKHNHILLHLPSHYSNKCDIKSQGRKYQVYRKYGGAFMRYLFPAVVERRFPETNEGTMPDARCHTIRQNERTNEHYFPKSSPQRELNFWVEFQFVGNIFLFFRFHFAVSHFTDHNYSVDCLKSLCPMYDIVRGSQSHIL